MIYSNGEKGKKKTILQNVLQFWHTHFYLIKIEDLYYHNFVESCYL